MAGGRILRCTFSCLLMLGLGAGASAAAEAPRPAPKKEPIRLNAKARTIEIDGEICLQEGALELFACGVGGKEYESLVRLHGKPSKLHFYLLALGLKPAEKRLKGQGDPKTPGGDRVHIYVEWRHDRTRRRVRAEDLIWDTRRNATMERTTFAFTGSYLVKSEETGQVEYMADHDLSIITVFHDPVAVLDNPLTTGGDDTVYVVNTKQVPPVGTPVQVIIQPVKKADSPPAKANH